MKTTLAFCYSKVIKYSEEDEEKGFHAALENDPKDETALLAYIDWLKDHDREAEAEIVLRNAKQEPKFNHNRVITAETKPGDQFAYRNYGTILSTPEVFVSNDDPFNQNVNVRLNLPSKSNLTKYFWLNGRFSYEEAKPVIKALAARGYKLAGVHWSHSDKIDKLTKQLHDEE